MEENNPLSLRGVCIHTTICFRCIVQCKIQYFYIAPQKKKTLKIIYIYIYIYIDIQYINEIIP